MCNLSIISCFILRLQKKRSTIKVLFGYFDKNRSDSYRSHEFLSRLSHDPL
nr:MAG TPA: hypothetical protein [Caudoviricetes sp.]